MPKLLLNLRLATDDEAEEIRQFLDQHELDWYETQSGFWGITAGGIWLRDLERSVEVKALLQQYQHDRLIRVRAERAREISEGKAHTFVRALKANPASLLLQLFAVVLLVLLTIGLPYVLLTGR